MKSETVKARRWMAGFVLLLASALTIVFMAPPSLMPALACDAEMDGHVLAASDFSQAPPQVVQDARDMAAALYDGEAKADEMAGQLVGTYRAAADQDFVVIFNPGGWGWDPVSEIPGWESILFGIEKTLDSFGYKTLLVDFKRTRHGFNGIIGELEVLAGLQLSKAEELAARVTFLTDHLPDLRVILTGESNGATIADNALSLLRENPRVFAIETGPPVWHPSIEFERSLLIENNGVQPDTFSNGDIILIIRSNAESAFGIYKGGRGDILLYIGAPGHFYSWDYPAVRAQVVDFLTTKFIPAPK
ncbi:MAG: hypothetical protein C4542_08670 [Dehalococcoidia bacterium]|nr:MAG: hypothetical protein C4542_08670 [Dehalococcoidia bacterium]